MKDQLKVLKAEHKGKRSAKVSPAVEELHYLLDFNASISQAAAKSMEHLSDFVFITMGNLTLVHRDAYLSHLRTGIKQFTGPGLKSFFCDCPGTVVARRTTGNFTFKMSLVCV